jgi:hypothetical protein
VFLFYLVRPPRLCGSDDDGGFQKPSGGDERRENGSPPVARPDGASSVSRGDQVEPDGGEVMRGGNDIGSKIEGSDHAPAPSCFPRGSPTNRSLKLSTSGLRSMTFLERLKWPSMYPG